MYRSFTINVRFLIKNGGKLFILLICWLTDKIFYFGTRNVFRGPNFAFLTLFKLVHQRSVSLVQLNPLHLVEGSLLVLLRRSRTLFHRHLVVVVLAVRVRYLLYDFERIRLRGCRRPAGLTGEGPSERNDHKSWQCVRQFFLPQRVNNFCTWIGVSLLNFVAE